MSAKYAGWYIHGATREERMVLSVIGERLRYDPSPSTGECEPVEVSVAEFAEWAKGAAPRPLS